MLVELVKSENVTDDDDLSELQSKACSTFEFITASTFNSDESLSSTEGYLQHSKHN